MVSFTLTSRSHVIIETLPNFGISAREFYVLRAWLDEVYSADIVHTVTSTDGTINLVTARASSECDTESLIQSLLAAGYIVTAHTVTP